MAHILAVDDSPTQLALLTDILTENGHTVANARDGKAGFDMWSGGDYDLVVSDIVMPELSGYELCQRIKAMPAGRMTPVVLLTTLSEPMDIIRGLECGADNFITKPYDPARLIARINQILLNKELRQKGGLDIGVEIVFLGARFTINSDKEQILDLLLSTFEDTVRANLELHSSRRELAEAKKQLEEYARTLEDRVQQRTRQLSETNEALTTEMKHRAEIETQLRQAQKMDAIGRLTGGIAHDFNNLLGVIIGNLELLAEGMDAADAPGLVQEALDGALRGAELTQRMLAFSRKQPLQPKIVNLNQALPGIVGMLKRVLPANIAVDMSPTDDLWLSRFDESQVHDVILNLAINARDAMPDGGLLSIETANVLIDDEEDTLLDPDLAPGAYVTLAVIDSGTGMPPEVIEKAFEPFFTTKAIGAGTGLGLSMVYGFAKQSGGHVKIYSEVGHGTSIKLYLPRAEKGPENTPERSGSVEAVGANGSETILVVEDNAQLRSVAVRILRGLGYDVREADNAQSAMEIQKTLKKLDLLFTDMVMPGGKTGLDLANAICETRPHLKVLLTTGYSEAFVKNRDETAGKAFLITKPYRKQDLAMRVRNILDGKE